MFFSFVRIIFIHFHINLKNIFHQGLSDWPSPSKYLVLCELYYIIHITRTRIDWKREDRGKLPCASIIFLRTRSPSCVAPPPFSLSPSFFFLSFFFSSLLRRKKFLLSDFYRHGRGTEMHGTVLLLCCGAAVATYSRWEMRSSRKTKHLNVSQ